PSGHRIYCVGGSESGGTTTSNRTAVFNPATNTFDGNDDNWTGNSNGDRLPGGFAVANNKLYVLGGFIVAGGMTRAIWQFDPNVASGLRWALKNGQVPAGSGDGSGLGYI